MLGVDVIIEYGVVKVKVDKLIGVNVFFDVVLVGVIINVMIVVIFVEGVIVLENVVKELYVVDVVNFLNFMGVNIKGVGIDVIRIIGVESLKGCVYSVVLD